MSSASAYTWTRSNGTVGKAYRAKWVGGDGLPHRKRGFDREADALRYAADREVEARHGIKIGEVAPTGRTTLEAWSKTWLAGLEVRPSTASSYAYALQRILPSLGGRSLAGLRPSEIKAWRRALGERLAPATVEQTVAVLAMMLRAAVQDGLIERTPMPPGRGGTGSRVVDPDELLTIEQVLAWDAALPAYARGMALVAAQTGLRQGELLGLRASRVDFLRRQIRVDEQLVMPAGAGRAEWGPPKTAAGVRTVPLPVQAAEALAEHVRLYPSPEGEPLYLGARGARWRRPTFGEAWRLARDKAGLPPWAHWHGLRDVALSGYVRAGVDVRTVMAIAGHSSPDETLRTYGRMWGDASDNARVAVEGLWNVDRAAALVPATALLPGHG